MASSQTFAKTRLAPTPSGYLHVGNILSFGITAALAKKYGAKVLLRIDDLDKVRANTLYIQDIFDTLNFLGAEWDEGPPDADEFGLVFSQMCRMDLYNAAIEKLKNAGHLFACICTRTDYSIEKCTCADQQLSFETASANWRIKTNNVAIVVKQLDGSYTESALPQSIHNFIIRKKDGYPSYQLASVVDDLYYGIDLIVRGQDLWDSTLAQLFLAKQLSESKFGDITFFHHSLINEASGQKLSKSAGATSIKYLRENGRSPKDIFGLILNNAGVGGKAKTWNEFVDLLTKNYTA